MLNVVKMWERNIVLRNLKWEFNKLSRNFQGRDGVLFKKLSDITLDLSFLWKLYDANDSAKNIADNKNFWKRVKFFL